MKAKQLVSTLVVALAFATAQVHSATPAPELPLSLALKAAQATLAACADPLVTVTVSDHEGVARVVLVGDAASLVGIASSRRKAYSSATTGMRTSKLAQVLAEMDVPSSLIHPELLPLPGYPLIDPELLPLPGGVPIVSHGVRIGAIGVEGGPHDEACAQAGIDSIKNDLE